MIYESSMYMLRLDITKKQANKGYHSGQCDQDIKELMEVPKIKRQLNKLDKEKLKLEVQEYGAWNEQQLSNHQDNLERFLWIACGDIVENHCLRLIKRIGLC